MSETVNIPISSLDAWVEVTGTGIEGFITSSKSIEYCIKVSQPDAQFIGHHLKTMDSFRYTIGSGEKLYVKATERTIIVLTEGA